MAIIFMKQDKRWVCRVKWGDRFDGLNTSYSKSDDTMVVKKTEQLKEENKKKKLSTPLYRMWARRIIPKNQL